MFDGLCHSKQTRNITAATDVTCISWDLVSICLPQTGPFGLFHGSPSLHLVTCPVTSRWAKNNWNLPNPSENGLTQLNRSSSGNWCLICDSSLYSELCQEQFWLPQESDSTWRSSFHLACKSTTRRCHHCPLSFSKTRSSRYELMSIEEHDTEVQGRSEGNQSSRPLWHNFHSLLPPTRENTVLITLEGQRLWKKIKDRGTREDKWKSKSQTEARKTEREMKRGEQRGRKQQTKYQ